MGFVTKIAGTYVSKKLASDLDEQRQVAKMAEDVLTGRMKRSAFEILLRGGKGISRRTNRIARKARRKMGDRY